MALHLMEKKKRKGLQKNAGQIMFGNKKRAGITYVPALVLKRNSRKFMDA